MHYAASCKTHHAMDCMAQGGRQAKGGVLKQHYSAHGEAVLRLEFVSADQAKVAARCSATALQSLCAC